jgi:hypothetical protein
MLVYYCTPLHSVDLAGIRPLLDLQRASKTLYVLLPGLSFLLVDSMSTSLHTQVPVSMQASLNGKNEE